MASSNQAFGEQFLDEIVQFIAKKYELDEIFSDSYILDFIQDNYDPAQVFSKDQLSEWAEKNGFCIKE